MYEINNNIKLNIMQYGTADIAKISLPKKGIPLDDRRRDGKRIEWKTKKRDSLRLSESLQRLAKEHPAERHIFAHKAENVACCASFLKYNPTADGNMVLNQAMFCKNPLCPICMWRKSEKLYNQTKTIIDHLEKNLEKKKDEHAYIFLTLTIKNVPYEGLEGAFNQLMKAWNKLTKKTVFRKMSKGYIRVMETTTKLSEREFHPHIHAMIAVDPEYLSERENYIDHGTFKALWQECLDVDYDPWIFVQRIIKRKGKGLGGRFKHSNKPISYAAAIAEMAKYTTKVNDFIVPWDDKQALGKFESNCGFKVESRKHAEKLTDEIVYWLGNAMYNRRCIGFGGVFRKAKKELMLEDIEKSSLIDTDGDKEKSSVLTDIFIDSVWDRGARDYKLYRMYRFVGNNREEMPLELYYDIVFKKPPPEG